MMDATFGYLSGQMRPHHSALLDDFARRSEAVARRFPAALDRRYGAHERERFDFFAAAEPWRGTLAYFHAGYWQSRDKAPFRFIADYLLPSGVDVALVNYPLCPEVAMTDLLASTRAAVAAVLQHAASLGRGGQHLVAAGHSAGGHIACELALAGAPIAAVAGLSGVYALQPLLETALNDKLLLDRDTARALSPVLHARSGLPPALFAVGGAETAAFREQNSDMAQAWRAAGNEVAVLEVPEADHFSLLDSPALWRAVLAVCK